jgi:hypothetical protein
MSWTDETPQRMEHRYSRDGCIVLPVPFLDRQLAALEQKGAAEGRTIGQTIRLAIGLFLAGNCDRCGANGGWGDSPLDMNSEADLEVFEVALLVPVALLPELVARATQRETSLGELIRHVACCSLLDQSLISPMPGEARCTPRVV